MAMTERERILYEAIMRIAEVEETPADGASRSWIDEKWRGMVREAEIAKLRFDKIGVRS